MTTDVNRIAENTGWAKERIQEIKKYVFLDKHDLGDKVDRFDPSYLMAQSWQRLIDGRNIKPEDWVLLNHEYLELSLVKKGLTQDNAHIIASRKYDYTNFPR